MTFDPSKNYGDNKVCLGLTGEFQGMSINAYASPDSIGQVYFSDGKEVGEPVEEAYGSPFPVDIVLLDDRIPQNGEMVKVRDEIGDAMAAQFDSKVDDVYEKVGDDNPLETILDLEPEDMIVEKDK